jgi:molybdopterin molybdotransferase
MPLEINERNLTMAFAIRNRATGGGIRLADAVAAIRAHLCPIRDTELVDLSQARGRVLAEDLIARVSLPHWDSAAVDGFALRASDLVPARLNKLTLVGEAAAGHPFGGIIGPRQAVRILTGAPLPMGADLVVMQEACRVDGSCLLVRGDTAGKTHWRVRGEDIDLGSRAIVVGRRLRAQDVALAGALGCKKLQVRRKARVGLFSTGDELCEPGEALANGQIWDANRCILRGLLEHLGCEVVDFGILRDKPELLEGALSRAAHDSDLLVTSGGMSVGSGDHIRSIIGRRGALEMWPLAIKPGKPVGLGDIDDCPILALPGNPIAAVVAFIAVGRPVVDVLSGASDNPPRSLSIPAGFTFEKRSGVRQFLLAEVRACDREDSKVMLSDRQGTAMLSALTGSDGFIVLAEDREVVRLGERVDFLPMQGYLS